MDAICVYGIGTAQINKEIYICTYIYIYIHFLVFVIFIFKSVIVSINYTCTHKMQVHIDICIHIYICTYIRMCVYIQIDGYVCVEVAAWASGRSF